MKFLALRKSKGFSQDELATKLAEEMGEKTPIGRATMSKYESGTVSMPLKYVLPICKVLACTPNELFGFEGEGEVVHKARLEFYQKRNAELEKELFKANEDIKKFKRHINSINALFNEEKPPEN